MSLTAQFAAALKSWRELRALSQEQLAVAAGLDRTYISELERGLKSPTLTTIEKLSSVLKVESAALLRSPRSMTIPSSPADYRVRKLDSITVQRGKSNVRVPTAPLIAAINTVHDRIDQFYDADLDIAALLQLRNLSAFVGELVAASILRDTDGLFLANPHQDGYPDLLLMDPIGKADWSRLANRLAEKRPFSPFPGGGIEVKATCGSVPTPESCIARGLARPILGESRIPVMSGYDWKAHHRDTNNLLGILWDFIAGRPRVAALFYSSDLTVDDWGRIVQPKEGGGRTTSVSIMHRQGIRKMYEGWLCVLSKGGYAEFLNKRNGQQTIPVG